MSVVKIDDLKENEMYIVSLHEFEKTVVIVHKIVTYPTTGMGKDYIFKYVSGYDSILKAAKNLPMNKGKETPDLFPLPEFIVSKLKFSKVK
jgi:hypothetical protein